MLVFVIDDDPIYKLIVCKMLSSHDLNPNVEAFENGALALKRLQLTAAVPDIIMLDIEMPVLNGWEFMERFYKLPEMIRGKPLIYIVSSSIANDDLSKVKLLPHIAGYVSKPLNKEKLDRILNAKSSHM